MLTATQEISISIDLTLKNFYGLTYLRSHFKIFSMMFCTLSGMVKWKKKRRLNIAKRLNFFLAFTLGRYAIDTVEEKSTERSNKIYLVCEFFKSSEALASHKTIDQYWRYGQRDINESETILSFTMSISKLFFYVHSY